MPLGGFVQESVGRSVHSRGGPYLVKYEWHSARRGTARAFKPWIVRYESVAATSCFLDEAA